MNDGANPPQEAPSATARWWPTVALPVHILLVGFAILILAGAALGLLQSGWARNALGWLNGRQQAGLHVTLIVAAGLVACVGLVVVAMLWWLADRFFGLIGNGMIKADAETLRDLPLGLPEGTVRSVLALIVAVVGLPLLLLSSALVSGAVAGYINGIIAGVFGFYFGSRTQGPAMQALNQIAAAGRQVEAAKAEMVAVARERDEIRARGNCKDSYDVLARQLELDQALLKSLAPLLPAGLLPDGFADRVQAADRVLKALDTDNPGPDAIKAADAAVPTLIPDSALDALAKKAAPMVGGSPARLAALLALGRFAGSVAFQRWRALLLAAPVTTALIDAASITPADVTDAAAPLATLSGAWKTALAKPGFADNLVPMLLVDDAADQLWTGYSRTELTPDGVFDTRADIQDGLERLPRELLAQRFAHDVTTETVGKVSGALAGAADAALDPGTLKPDDLMAAARAASDASAAAGAAVDARAAFDGLVTLVGLARDGQVNLPAALAEVAS